ncbi:hypothetical protein RJ640_025122, partial [Escallonia rubra]
GESYTRRADTLKRDIRRMLDQVEEPLNKFQLIDTLQRLGISYHFEVEIKRTLERIHSNTNKSNRWNKEAVLYVIALEFRLYRQHGFDVPQEIFNSFKDEAGNFKLCICEDTRGMLYLYEASYLSIRGEGLLDEARHFTAKHLTESLKDQKMDQNLATFVSHALELPLHWRMPRLEARWWKGTGLGEKLSCGMDRVMENGFWTVGMSCEPLLQYTRRMTTRLISLITVIDDIYDVYGTLEELELFTNAVERWDINELDRLPDFMKICFFALYNSSNEMAYDDQLKIGDSPKSTQCYMNEISCSEEEARRYIKHLSREAWKKINEGRVSDSPFSGIFIDTAINLARTAQCMYQLGDDRGIDDDVTKERVTKSYKN